MIETKEKCALFVLDYMQTHWGVFPFKMDRDRTYAIDLYYGGHLKRVCISCLGDTIKVFGPECTLAAEVSVRKEYRCAFAQAVHMVLDGVGLDMLGLQRATKICTVNSGSPPK